MTNSTDLQRPPTHPGEILRNDVLPSLELTVSEAARQLRVTRQTLHRVLAGKSGISPEMAVRLGRFCGNGPGFWLRLQQAHDLWHAERRLRIELEKIPARGGSAEHFPPAARRGTLAEFFAESPLRGSGITLERPQDGPREIDLFQSPVRGWSSSKRS